MSSKLQRELYRAAALTFEQLGFMFSSAELDDHQQEMPVDAEVGVMFQGPFDGALILRLNSTALRTLTTNMLGAQGIPSQKHEQDALGEMVNVICGNLLPAIGGPDEVFRIGPPQLGRGLLPPENDQNASVTAVGVGLDQGRAEILLVISKRAALCL